MNKSTKLSFSIISLFLALFLSFNSLNAQGTKAYGYNANGGGGIPVGPFYFYLENPGTLTSIQNQQGQDLVLSGSWANGIWYACVGNNLITFNTVTGSRTIVGNMGRSINGMSYDITTNTMYGVAWESDNGNLYTINLTSGATQLVGSIGPGMLFINLACDNNGNLYGLNLYDDALHIIDKETGVATLIGEIGYSLNYAQDMEFDLVENVCYAASIYEDGGWIGNLLRIDIETGEATVAGYFPNSNMEVTGFAIPFTPECLAFPKLVEPTNRAIEVQFSPAFIWSDVEDAETYTIQIATDPAFEEIFFEQDGIVGSYFNLPFGSELEATTTYWWHIMAHSGDDCNSYWSNKWSFTTEGELLPPILTSPSDEATEVFSYPTLTWQSVSGAENYHVQLASDEFFNDLLYDQEGISTNRFFARALELGSTYYWRVLAYNASVSSDWSEEWSFLTTDISPFFGYNASGGGLSVGTVVFDRNTPSNMYVLQNQAGTPFVRAATWANGAWYGTIFDNNVGTLISINKVTGARSNIGNHSVNVTGMSYDVTTETLYAAVSTDDGASLYTINISNGSATLVGVSGEHLFINLACNIHGDLYAVDLVDDGFYYIDKYTGIPTLIGLTGADVNYAQDMEFDLENDICYWAAYTSSGGLYTVNVETGIPTLVGAFPGGLELTGFAIPFAEPCLAFPQLSEPANNSHCQSITPDFDWNTVVGANYYALQVASDKNFNNIVYENDEINSSNFSLPMANALESLTSYYWRIMAFGEPGCQSYWSGKFSFITEGDLPAPSLSSPINGMDGVNPTVTFNWEGHLAAIQFHIQVSSTEDFTGIVVDNEYLTGPSYTYSSLAPLTEYYWRVSMRNPCSESQWSEVWTFTTGYLFTIGTDRTMNDEYEYPAPYGNYWWGAKHQILMLAEEMEAAGASAGFITALAFEVGAINSLDPLYDFTIKMKQTNLNQLVTGWEVDNLQQVYSSAAYYNTMGWNYHSFDTPFMWDGESNVIVDVCFNNNFYSANQGTYYSETTYNSVLITAADNTEVCTNPGTAVSSADRPNMRFVAMEGETAPDAPVLSLPENGATGESKNPLLSWESVFNAANYVVQLSENSEFDQLVVNEITSDTELLVELDLEYSTQYWWRVRAVTQYGTYGLWATAWSFTTELESLNIQLSTGWNLISSYITPEDSDIEEIFAEISDDLKIVKNGAGQIYDPSQGINSIGNWYYSDAYLVNMLNANTLSVIGTKVVPQSTPLFLNTGWNMSAYFRDNPMSPSNALTGIGSVLVLAKSNSGDLYSPTYGINTIGNLMPGQGYYLYLNDNSILMYPANSSPKSTVTETTPVAKFLIPDCKNTGNNATLILTIDENDGNEIGVFNSDNVLIGSGAIHNGVAALTIWGNDEFNPNTKAALDNELLFVKLYNTNNNSLVDIDLVGISEITNSDASDCLSYKTNAIYLAKAVIPSEESYKFGIAIVPNPVASSTSFEFTLPYEANAEIQIYNLRGELVDNLAAKDYSIGFNKIHFDASNLASGVYNVVLTSAERRIATVMIVNK